jgi:hypothetical protein
VSSGARTPSGAAGRRERPSAAKRHQAIVTIQAYNNIRDQRPACGAKSRTTGEQCRQRAMQNGKCAWHGGKTPSGAAWHKMTIPDGDRIDAVEKLDAKLRDHRKAERKRARRVAAMSPEELSAYKSWKRSHKPGTLASRARIRAERDQAAAARELLARPARPPSAEALDLEAQITALRAVIARLTTNSADDGDPPFQGAFA